MKGQLRLISEGTGTTPIVLDVDMTTELLERFRALDAGERMELQIRAPGALAELIDRIGYLDDLQTFELRHLATDIQRDLKRVKEKLAERYDADRCPECHVHQRNGHLFGCSIAEADAAERVRKDLGE